MTRTRFHLPLLLLLVGSTAAFVPLLSTRRTSNSLVFQQKKNFVEEILDGLDTLAGVSPLSEADLKDSNSDNLIQRMNQRDQMAPPPDALQKKSVSVFFSLLALIPALLFVAAIQSGFRPFGL